MQQKENLQKSSEYFEKAYKFHLDGEIDKAIEDYKASIQIYPTAKAYTFLGWAYSLQKRYEDAIEECMKAIELEPDYGNPYMDIGNYLIELGRPYEAIDWLEKAFNYIDSNSSHFPLFSLGRAYEKTGDWLLALKFYNKALSIDQDYDEAQNAVIRISTLLN